MIYEHKASCVALGNFDGIHIGHDKLIKRMMELSSEKNQDSVIITFKYVKRDLKKSNCNLKYISSLSKKYEMLKSYGASEVVEIELDDVISKYSPEQFIKEILVNRFNAKNIVVGYNFTFGYKAAGNIETLRKYQDMYDYDVEEIHSVKYNGVAVSSTLIRNLIKAGKIKEVNNLLIRKYTIYSDNILFDKNKNLCTVNASSGIIIPPRGKYRVQIGNDDVCLTVINNNKEGSIFTFDKKIDVIDKIVFLDKWFTLQKIQVYIYKNKNMC